MESVGQELRGERVRLALTLQQVSAQTRISLKNLEAIENDELTKLGSPFFYKSFVRQFAQHLNLDYSTLAVGVQEAVSRMPQPYVPGEHEVDRPTLRSVRVSPRMNLKWVYSVASFVLMLMGCSTLYAIWQNSKSNWHASVATLVSGIAQQPARHLVSVQKSVAVARPPAGVQLTRTLQPSEALPETSATASTIAAESNAPFRIELSALEPTWLSIIADGKEMFSGILEAEETKILEGHETARIRTGNAGGLSFVFNGRMIGPVGARGQVRTVVFTKDDYEILDSLPHIALTRFSTATE